MSLWFQSGGLVLGDGGTVCLGLGYMAWYIAFP